MGRQPTVKDQHVQQLTVLLGQPTDAWLLPGWCFSTPAGQQGRNHAPHMCPLFLFDMSQMGVAG
jgi:hypothetical protein